MSSGWFVTGTDTGVGKTCVSVALLHALAARGCRVAAMKPVASGCARRGGAFRNDDADQLRALCTVRPPYQLVNPYAFEPPVAPHLAAAEAGTVIDIARIRDAFVELRAAADAVVVEGVGGWLVPVDGRLTMQDVAIVLGLPVLLVVGIRLGCLNHALLTANAVRASGLELAGWIANRVDPGCDRQDENVRALQERLDAPLLADFPYAEGADWPGRRFGALDLARLGIS